MKLVFAVLIICSCLHTAAQNVGIGQPNPLYKLHIGNNNPNTLLLDNTQNLLTGTENNLYFRVGSFYTAGIKTIGLTNSTSRMGFFTKSHLFPSNLLERLSILDDGKIGVNNTAPAQTLDINGTAAVSGAVEVGGSLDVTGPTTLSTLKISGSQPGAGRILTSDALGNASWKKPNEGTHNLIIPALSMVPNTPIECGFYGLPWGTGLGRGFAANNTTGRLLAPFTLPDGAVIKKVKLVCYLNDPEIVGIWLRIGYYEHNGSTMINGGIASNSFFGIQNSNVQTVSSTDVFAHTVVNAHRSYFVATDLYTGGKWKAANSIFFWFEVEYDL